MLLSVPLLLPFPKHDSASGILCHRAIFGCVVREIFSHTRHAELFGRPIAQVVAARVHAVHHDVRVSACREVRLDRFVRTIRFADEKCAPARHQVIQLGTNDRV